MSRDIDRRTFLKVGAAVAAGGIASTQAWAGAPGVEAAGLARPRAAVGGREYRGPNVVVVRFGGGVRRRETIDPQGTYCPYTLHEFAKRGTFFPRMEISQLAGVNTSHGEGTLNILTGRYDTYTDVDDRVLGARFEAKTPTIFEYLRKACAIPAHETLIVNGEDRTDEEFYTFSNHHLFGVDYRSHTLSLYRYKTYLLRQRIAAGEFAGQELTQRQAELRSLEALDRRATERDGQGAAIDTFWAEWRRLYGDTGFKNERGDRLLTQLAIGAITRLRPKLLMINYQDPDYVHWGNLSHYTRGIATIDDGLRQLVTAIEADEAYRDNTVFVVVPDCGRDDNRFMHVPCQHHFNSKSSHEIWAMVVAPGMPGIAHGRVVDRVVNQAQVAATIGRIMGFTAEHSEGEPLAEVFA